MERLRPEHGLRVLLELERADATGAAYRVELHAPESACEGRAAIALASGSVTFERFVPAEPEPWMLETARAFLRTLHKNHAAAGDWPRRILRWREKKAVHG